MRRFIIVGLVGIVAALVGGGVVLRARGNASAYHNNQIQVGDINDDGYINFPGDVILLAKMSFGLAATPVPYNIPPTETPTASPTATATPHPCTGAAANAVWSGGSGHCYQRFDSGKTFLRARLDCESRGDHLATIADQAEADFVRYTAAINADFWIGFTDELVEGDFHWITGEPVAYTNWNGGEPNNGGSGWALEDATIFNPFFNAGAWNDAPVGINLGYICESY